MCGASIIIRHSVITVKLNYMFSASIVHTRISQWQMTLSLRVTAGRKMSTYSTPKADGCDIHTYYTHVTHATQVEAFSGRLSLCLSPALAQELCVLDLEH